MTKFLCTIIINDLTISSKSILQSSLHDTYIVHQLQVYYVHIRSNYKHATFIMTALVIIKTTRTIVNKTFTLLNLGQVVP